MATGSRLVSEIFGIDRVTAADAAPVATTPLVRARFTASGQGNVLETFIQTTGAATLIPVYELSSGEQFEDEDQEYVINAASSRIHDFKVFATYPMAFRVSSLGAGAVVTIRGAWGAHQ